MRYTFLVHKGVEVQAAAAAVALCLVRWESGPYMNQLDAKFAVWRVAVCLTVSRSAQWAVVMAHASSFNCYQSRVIVATYNAVHHAQ